MSLQAGLYLSKDFYTSQGQCMCIEHTQSVLHSYSSAVPSLLLFVLMLMFSLVVAFLRLHFSVYAVTSVMIYHCGASLSEQHTDLLCTKQDLSHTSRYVDESSPEIARYRIRMPTARTATLSVTTFA